MGSSFVESAPQNSSSVLHNAAKTLKMLLLSAGLISTLLMVKGPLMPYSCEILFSNLMRFWDCIRRFLSSPLYICLIINSMVLLIVASSTFHRNETDNHCYDIKSTIVEDPDTLISESALISPPPPPPPLSLPRDVTCITLQPPRRDVTEAEPPPRPPPPQPETLLSRNEKWSTPSLYQGSDHDDYTLILHDSTAQDCFGKANLSSPDGEMVTTNPPPHRKENGLFSGMEAEVTHNQPHEKENEEDDTMEARWKAITGAETKQLEKSKTWKPRIRATVQSLHSEELPPSTTTWKDLRKSETFNEAVSIRRIGGLRRDPSVGIDEFNQKVEAFIKKVNEDMRLQRQESDQRFLDMIDRGL